MENQYYNLEKLIKFRRDLHEYLLFFVEKTTFIRNPESSFKEYSTSNKCHEYLKSINVIKNILSINSRFKKLK